MKRIFIALTGVLLVLSSCSNKVDFGEQYKKELYIINSKESLYYVDHAVSEQSKGNISVYVTGSELPTEDIHVSYELNKEALDYYNKKEYGDNESLYFEMIPENLYTFETKEVTVKKGEPYGCLNFTINTQALRPDKVYVLPISITGAGNYGISKSLNTILYVIRVWNGYAGNYSSSYMELGGDNLTLEGLGKKAIALSARKILFPIGPKSNLSSTNEDQMDFNKEYYQVTINEDFSLTIEPFLQSVIRQDPDKSENYYDPEARAFHIAYLLQDEYGEEYNVYETITRM